ncbi:MAG TPA: TolC family protein [Ignavibacteria bacterium]|nr:TolC family protein [Ignavibacteria bacterium]
MKSNKFIITGLLCTALFITAIHPDVNAQTKNLRYYIDCAVNSDPVIQENTNLLNTGIISKELIYSQYKKPHIFGTANYLFAPAFGEYSYDSSITNGGLYSALINLEMPLFTGFSSSAKLEDINNDLTSYSNTILITRHEIEKNVTAQYYKVFQGQQQIAAIDEILKILDYQKEIVMLRKQLYRAT